MRVVSFTFWSLNPSGISPRWYPLNRRLGWPRRRSGCFGEEEKVWPWPGFEVRDFQPESPLVLHLAGSIEMLNKLHEVELFGDASSLSASLKRYRLCRTSKMVIFIQNIRKLAVYT